jgi:hypothetical protein
VTGERFARVLTGLAVLAVAVVAGYVSYGHIEVLALGHGYGIDAARVLPISVDGLIVAASMALLTGSAPWLARAGLVLGILATLAANIAAGAQFGVVGALVNAWPAVAFIVASEILLRSLRAARDIPSASGTAVTVAAEAPTAPGTVADAVPGETVQGSPSVPESDPVGVPVLVPKDVPRMAPVAPVRARGQARRRTPKQSDPVRVFAAEIKAGEMPSVRSIKERCHVGTDRAREIQSELKARLKVPEAA